MKYRELLKEGMEELKKAGTTDAQIDAEYLLEYVSGMNRASYLMCMMEQVPEDVIERYREFIKMRAAHEPLQYITGEQEFMGLSFAVSPEVLIPRQDTESLVEETLSVLKDGDLILDMCTGSGCILISLEHYRKGIRAVGADISDEALQVAKRNAESLNADVTFLKSDLFEQVAERYDLIVSNPPYIRTKAIEELEEEVRLHDPMIALDGKEDGLYFYRKITEKSREHLKQGGWLLFEIGYDQGEDVAKMMEKAGFTEVTVKKDLAGLDRVVSGMYNR